MYVGPIWLIPFARMIKNNRRDTLLRQIAEDSGGDSSLFLILRTPEVTEDILTKSAFDKLAKL